MQASVPDKRALAAGDEIDATTLMNWAELNFSHFFPSREGNQSAPPYVYRFYPATQNYLGIDGNVIRVLGPLSGGEILTVGTLQDFACQVRIDTCEAPQIIAGPQNASVAPGASVAFTASVGGGPSIVYQWLRNEVAIAGAHGSSYALQAQAGDNGARFALRAGNAKGSATSAPATLTVAAPFDPAAAQALAEASGCFSCHGVTFGGQGPAFRSVALRYGSNPTIAATLVSRVLNGTGGNWGGFASMPAQSHVAEGDVQLIVEWILSLR